MTELELWRVMQLHHKRGSLEQSLAQYADLIGKGTLLKARNRLARNASKTPAEALAAMISELSKMQRVHRISHTRHQRYTPKGRKLPTPKAEIKATQARIKRLREEIAQDLLQNGPQPVKQIEERYDVSFEEIRQGQVYWFQTDGTTARATSVARNELQAGSVAS